MNTPSRPNTSLRLSTLEKARAWVQALVVLRQCNRPAMSILIVLLKFSPAALLISWKIATSSFQSGQKPWRRRLVENAFQATVALNLSAAQMSYLGGGTTHDAYLNWAKRRGVLVQEEVIAHEARILWIGERRTKKVILYFHGGGYLSSVQGFQLDYVSGMLGRLQKSGKSVSIALLEYSLSNIATFPIQLKQGVAAIQYLFELGYDPSDIVLVGDSAGGNLLFQLLLHILHPVDDVDRLEVFSECDSAFAGAFAMSPWLGLSNTDAQSWEENKYFDIADARGLSGLAQLYLHGVPQWAYRYVDPASSTPATWFKGVDGIVRKVLITAGQRECLRDDIIKVGKYMTDHHPLGTTVIVQEGGLHVDVMLDMPLNQSPPVELTDTIFKWLIEVI